MKVTELDLKGIYLIEPDIHTDFRGEYVMTYRKDLYDRFGIDFIEHDISTSSKGVLRGIHYSPHCWKLYQCLHGALYYVFVNCDKKDTEFGKWTSIILNDRNHWQILKHPKYGAGFVALEDNSLLHYMQNQYYDAKDPDQKTFKWFDTKFRIWWPKVTPVPILSRRDEIGEYEFRTAK